MVLFFKTLEEAEKCAYDTGGKLAIAPDDFDIDQITLYEGFAMLVDPEPDEEFMRAHPYAVFYPDDEFDVEEE